MFGCSVSRKPRIAQYGNFAKAGAYTIVSQDADFAEMAVLLGTPPKVIWIRAGNKSRAAIATLLNHHADLIIAFEDDEAVCLQIY